MLNDWPLHDFMDSFGGNVAEKEIRDISFKTMTSLSLDRMPENIPMAPCRMVTTVNIVATLNAMPAMLINDRMR